MNSTCELGDDAAHALKPYPDYKDSRIEWLGEVPKHWITERFKSLMHNIVEQTTERRGAGLYVALEHVESWTGRLRHAGLDVSFDSQVKCFRSGDVLFGKLRPYLAKVTRPTSDGICVGEFLVLRPRHSNATAPYMEQLLRSKPIIDAVNSSTFGAKMPRADWQFMGGMAIALPPLPEQAAIVRFLDHADRRIRRYIRAKQQLITLLEEQKQAIIHQAVTGQIDVRTGKPYRAYKDSRVEWLGEVPETWDVVALRHRYSQCLGKMLDSKRITGDHSVPYLRNVDIQWDQINVDNLPVMDISPDEHERFTVKRDDLLVCEGGEVGRCALWSDELTKCGFQKALHRLRPRNTGQDVPRFMYYVLRAAARSGAFDDGHLSTIAHLTGDKLRAHRLPFPTVEEQDSIVGFLDDRLARLDRACIHTLREVECLNEYRTSLIADVVTGKFDVREAAARLQDEVEELEPLDEADALIDGEDEPTDALATAP